VSVNLTEVRVRTGNRLPQVSTIVTCQGALSYLRDVNAAYVKREHEIVFRPTCYYF